MLRSILVKIIMKVAQTGVSSLESIQTPKFFKTARCLKKVQVGKDQEKVQSEKDSHSKNRGGKKKKKKKTKKKKQTNKQINNQALIP